MCEKREINDILDLMPILPVPPYKPGTLPFLGCKNTIE